MPPIQRLSQTEKRGRGGKIEIKLLLPRKRGNMFRGS